MPWVVRCGVRLDPLQSVTPGSTLYLQRFSICYRCRDDWWRLRESGNAAALICTKQSVTASFETQSRLLPLHGWSQPVALSWFWPCFQQDVSIINKPSTCHNNLNCLRLDPTCTLDNFSWKLYGRHAVTTVGSPNEAYAERPFLLRWPPAAKLKLGQAAKLTCPAFSERLNVKATTPQPLTIPVEGVLFPKHDVKAEFPPGRNTICYEKASYGPDKKRHWSRFINASTATWTPLHDHNCLSDPASCKKKFPVPICRPATTYIVNENCNSCVIASRQSIHITAKNSRSQFPDVNLELDISLIWVENTVILLLPARPKKSDCFWRWFFFSFRFSSIKRCIYELQQKLLEGNILFEVTFPTCSETKYPDRISQISIRITTVFEVIENCFKLRAIKIYFSRSMSSLS